MRADSVDAETAARIDRYTDELMRTWPPLSEEQIAEVARILNAQVRLPVSRGGDHA